MPMSETLDEVYQRCDNEEKACQAAQERYDDARTPIGRLVARLSLRSHRAQLAQAYEEAETGEFRAIRPNE